MVYVTDMALELLTEFPIWQHEHPFRTKKEFRVLGTPPSHLIRSSGDKADTHNNLYIYNSSMLFQYVLRFRKDFIRSLQPYN